ncbi:hypothetical protein G6F56_005568 [Rhizopus delemar]|nr:hypothetical protein G6F56_005568 [Rhizopus delemar]
MSNETMDFDLNKQLQSFSISSEEEKITKELENAQLTDRNTSIFSVPKATTNTTNFQETQPQPPPKQTEEKDGWGEGPPSYTSISQGTYFGFNSIIQSDILPTTTTESPNEQQAFSRFKNKPISFTSHLNK